MDAFLASLTPEQYRELTDSWQCDPPVEDRLDLILSRIEWRLAHLFAKREDVTPFSEFRVKWDAESPVVDETETPNGESDLRDAMRAWGAKPAVRLAPGTGAPVDFAALGIVDLTVAPQPDDA